MRNCLEQTIDKNRGYHAFQACGTRKNAAVFTACLRSLWPPDVHRQINPAMLLDTRPDVDTCTIFEK